MNLLTKISSHIIFLSFCPLLSMNIDYSPTLNELKKENSELMFLCAQSYENQQVIRELEELSKLDQKSCFEQLNIKELSQLIKIANAANYFDAPIVLDAGVSILIKRYIELSYKQDFLEQFVKLHTDLQSLISNSYYVQVNLKKCN